MIQALEQRGVYSSGRCFFLVCQLPARHPLPTKCLTSKSQGCEVDGRSADARLDYQPPDAQHICRRQHGAAARFCRCLGANCLRSPTHTPMNSSNPPSPASNERLKDFRIHWLCPRRYGVEFILQNLHHLCPDLLSGHLGHTSHSIGVDNGACRPHRGLYRSDHGFDCRPHEHPLG